MLVTMSNPGLSFAVLGNPMRKRFVCGRARRLTTPKSKDSTMARRRRFRRSYSLLSNPLPAVKGLAKDFAGGFTGLPKAISLFKGKNALPNAGFAAGGVLAGMVGGSFVNGMILKGLGKIKPSLETDATAMRVVGALGNYAVGFAVSKFAPVSPERKQALLTGAAVAAIVELIKPGLMREQLKKVPGIKELPGIKGYEIAPGYQGQGEYVSAANYQGSMGAYEALAYTPGSNTLADYTIQPNYQAVSNGSVGEEVGANMRSFLDIGP